MTHNQRPAVTLKEGDTHPTFTDTLVDNPHTDEPIDLEDFSTPSVTLFVEHVPTGELVVNSPAEIIDAENAVVSYTFDASETSRSGKHVAEWVVRDSGGDTTRTVPQESYRVIEVTEPLARDADPETVDKNITVTTVNADEIRSNTQPYVTLASHLHDSAGNTIYDQNDNKIPVGVLDAAIRPDVMDDAGHVASDVEAFDFSDNLSVVNNGDGTVTINASGGDLAHAVEDNGIEIEPSVSTVNFGMNLDVTADGNNAVTVDGSEPGHSVSDNGSVVVSSPTDVNFGSNLAVTDEGNGTVTIDGSGGDGGGSSWSAASIRTDSSEPNQTISSGTWTEARFDTTRFDWGGIGDPGANSITVPEDGVYWVSYRTAWEDSMSSGTRLLTTAALNGVRLIANEQMSVATGGEAHTNALTIPYELSAGNEISIQVYHNEGSDLQLRAGAQNYLALVRADTSGGGGGGGGRPLDEAPNHHIPFTELADGQALRQPVQIPANQTLTIYGWGAVDTDGNSPSGLSVQLRNPDGTVNSESSTAWSTNVSGIASYANTSSSLEVAELAIENNTGSDYTDPDAVGGRIGYEIS